MKPKARAMRALLLVGGAWSGCSTPGGMLETFGIVFEHEAFEQSAGNGTLVFRQFADGFEVMLQVVGDRTLAGIKRKSEKGDEAKKGTEEINSPR